MKIKAVRNQRAMFSKNLISIVLCTSITLLVSTSIYYTYYVKIQKEQTFLSDLSHLTQTSKEVVNLTEAAQSLSFQIYRNSTISKLMFYENPDIYEVTAAMSELGNYLSSMPYIESIYVYNPKSEHIYIASSKGQNGVFAEQELKDTGVLDILGHYRDYKPFTPIPRIYSNGAEEDDQVRAYTFLCYDAIGWDRSINSAVIVNISAAWINKEITTNLFPESATFILDDRGKILSSQSLEEQTLSPVESDWFNVKIRERETGSFTASYQELPSLVSYTSPDDLGWQYVRVTPYHLITEQTERILQATLLIAGVILLAGLLTSWLISKRLYLPIDRIVREMNVLEADKRNSMFTIKQNSLRDLVLGQKPLHPLDQVEGLQRLGIHFTLNEDYRLIVLRIDRYAELPEDRSSYLLAYKFAIMNIASEIFGQTYRVETVDMNDDSLLVLLNIMDPAEDRDTELLETLLRQVREACADYLKISLSAAYSPVDRNPAQLPRLYKQVREASKHRFFYGRGCIINAKAIQELQGNVHHYPTDTEKKLTDALLSGKTEEARRYFSEIVRGTTLNPYHVAQLSVSRLSVTLKNVIDQIQKSNQFRFEAEWEPPALDSFEIIDDLEHFYFTLFDELRNKLAEKKNTKQHELISEIDRIIDQSFHDPNFSLNLIADKLGLSPVYVSRLYKQATLTGITEVILTKRLNEVCRLLEQTDHSITLIAEQTGFTSSSYLHRMFKRSFGSTPADYRRSKRPAASNG